MLIEIDYLKIPLCKFCKQFYVINKWLFAGKAANKGIGGIGNTLSKIPDRNMGFVNMDEHFDTAILKDGERDYHNTFSTSFAEYKIE